MDARTQEAAVDRDAADTSVMLIGDTSDRWNWGCRATSAALRDMIQQRARITHSLDCRRLAEPVPATVDLRYSTPSAAAPQGSSAIAGRVAQRAISGARPLIELGRPLIERMPVRSLDRQLQYQLTAARLDGLADAIGSGSFLPHVGAAIAASDVVIVNGEGGILDSRFAGRLCMLLAFTAKTRFGKPCSIVNHSADIRHPTMRGVAERVYALLDEVAVREWSSFESLSAIAPQVRFAADAVFSRFGSVASAPGPFGEGQPYICVGGTSAYLDLGAARHVELARDFRRLCTSLGELAPVVLTASSEPDDAILAPVAADLGLPYYGLETSVDDAIALLGSAALYVGGRWHPSIMAMLGGTPIVGFGANTSYKSDGILRLAKLTTPSFDPFDLDRCRDDIVRAAVQLLDAGQELRSSLVDTARELAASSHENIHILTS